MRIEWNNRNMAIAILAAALLIALALNALKPRVKKGRTAPAIPVVSVMELSPSTHSQQIEVNGTVIPARKIEILAEAEGMAVHVNPLLVPGGILARDEVILKIDSTDYELDIRNKKASVAEARLNLELEKAQQSIARGEWEADGAAGPQASSNRSLALREPQIENALARLDAARSSLEAAMVAKERTVVRSPFKALVLEKDISRGQLVVRQRPVATLVDTEEFWVEVSIPLDKLRWIRFPAGKGDAATRAQVVLDMGSGRKAVREAEAYRLHGELDPKGRMARVLFRIPDPLGLDSGTPADNGRFLLGSFVSLVIDAGSMDNAFSVPRAALRDNDTVWLLSGENTLDIRNVDVAWLRKDDVLVTEGLSAGDRLITSSLQSPLPGMALMPEERKPLAGQDSGLGNSI